MLLKITSLSTYYKLQHHFYVSDFFAQLDTLSIKNS